MADLRRTIEIIFAATDEASPQVEKLASSLEAIGGAAGGIVGGLASATEFILKLDSAIVGLGAAALAFAFSRAIDFQKSIAELDSVLKDGQGTAADFEGQITALSEQFGIAAGDVAGGAAQFVKANFSTSESFTLLESALTQTRLSQLSVSESSELLRKTLAGFGAGVGDATKLIDIFAKISDNSSVSVDQLANAFATIAPTANRLGLSFEETTGFLVPLIERLGDGGAAAQLLGTGFLKLLDPSKEAREVLDNLGIAQRAANGEFLSGEPLLKNIQVGFADLTKEQQLFLSSVLVGTRQSKEFADVLGGSARQQDIFKLATESTGARVAELAEQLALSQAAIDRFGVALTNAARSVGEEFRPEATGAIDALTVLTQSFRDVVTSGGLEPLFAVLRPLLDDFSASIKGIASALPDAFSGLEFGGLVDSLRDLGGAFSGLFDGVDLTTANGLRSALQGVVDVGETLVRLTSGIVESFGPLIRSLISGAGGATELGKSFGESLGNILGVTTQLGAFAPLLSGLTTSLGLVSSALTILWTTQSLLGVDSLGEFRAVVAAFAEDLISLGARGIDLFTSALLGMDGALAKIGIAAALAAITFEVTSLIVATEPGQKAITGLLDVVDAVTNALGITEDVGAKAIEPTVVSLDKLAKTAQTTAVAATALQAAITPQADEFVSLSAAGREAAEGVNEANKSLSLFAGDSQVTRTLTTIGDSILAISEGDFSPLEASLKEATDEARGFSQTLEDGIPVFTQFAGRGVDSAKQVATQVEELRKKSDEFLLKLREIDSQERVKTFEIVANVQIEQLKTDSEKIIEITQSISEAFQSTGQVIGTALGALGDVGGSFAQEKLSLIEDQLERENKLREQAAEQQKELTNATIEEIQARTDALRDGGGIIKIEADGLEPELEAFMFKILERVQLRAVEQNAAFLLGLGS